MKLRLMPMTTFVGVYGSRDLNFALHEATPGGALKRFLEKKGIRVHPFDGKFGSLLNINQPIGTMAAITFGIGSSFHARAHVMINGTYLHSPPLVTSLIFQYFHE